VGLKILEIKKTIIMASKKKVQKLKREVEDLKERLNLTEEQAELLDSVVKLNLQRTEFHLSMVKQHTGEILMEDVTYCINLSTRITEYLKQRMEVLEY
jgi:phage terminase large subunit-like protein